MHSDCAAHVRRADKTGKIGRISALHVHASQSDAQLLLADIRYISDKQLVKPRHVPKLADAL